MSIIRLIGDVHGKFRRYSTILDNSPYPTIQVGDMGIGFRNAHGDFSANPPYDKMLAGGHRFIRGNHDNPAVCAKHSQYIPDGTVEDNIMFVGGALSIDRVYRTEGWSWWDDEEIDGEGLELARIIYKKAKPEIMVTHECPESIAEMIVATIPCVGNGQTKLDPRFASRTREAFDFMLGHHRPKLWVFGHWHVPFDTIVNGTRFICLPELAIVDIDTEKSEVLDQPTQAFEREFLKPLDNDF
jgi:hypothetical protein